ncbi:hypothetical protein GCM10022214_02040 [Actinomadura miaoliensis]|uniref:TadE-like domain-containing protein n=1 Tax=Actinomadura miaoliensis TaxID=430685 RepID=A0ABP7UWU6_9ACTN
MIKMGVHVGGITTIGTCPQSPSATSTASRWASRPPARRSDNLARTQFGAGQARDAGNAVVETAILAPVFITLLTGLLMVMRVMHGSAVVAQAAAYAAQQASIARTASQARAEANISAMHALRDRSALHAARPTWSVRLQSSAGWPRCPSR